jgi:hypothetical protein
MEHKANHCTVELSHGGTVHVGEPMADVLARIKAARMDGNNLRSSQDGWVTLKRIDGDPAIPRSARQWLEFEVDASQVIAVFPIDQGSVPIHNPAARDEAAIALGNVARHLERMANPVLGGDTPIPAE